MQKFILRRLVFAVFSLLAATVVVFSLSRGTGDPILLYAKPGGYGISPEQIAALREKLALDRPLVVQYLTWLGQALRGDLGNTLLDDRPVINVIREKIFNSLQLAMGGWLFAAIVGLPLGVLSAVKRGTIADYFGRMFALFGMATPHFWVGLVMILIFSVYLGILPVGSRSFEHTFPLAWENVKYFIMPAVVVGWYPAAGWLRVTRSAMLEVLDSEYIKFARARGVSEAKVIWKHAFKNAAIPPLTMMAINMASFIGGSVVTETVFSWPGIGRLAVQSIHNNDFPTLTACVLIFAALFITANFLADLAYAYIDPRIRYS